MQCPKTGKLWSHKHVHWEQGNYYKLIQTVIWTWEMNKNCPGRTLHLWQGCVISSSRTTEALCWFSTSSLLHLNYTPVLNSSLYWEQRLLHSLSQLTCCQTHPGCPSRAQQSTGYGNSNESDIKTTSLTCKLAVIMLLEPGYFASDMLALDLNLGRLTTEQGLHLF